MLSNHCLFIDRIFAKEGIKFNLIVNRQFVSGLKRIRHIICHTIWVREFRCSL